MARMARAVFEGVPHHVTQRGNGRARTFFSEGDYRLYKDLLAEHSERTGVEVWSWVLMPNHVHLILVPPDSDALRRCLAPVHRYYAGYIHTREQRTGHFWQGRFGCVAMDEPHLVAAVRYVVMNPVRARLVPRATDWRWSSVHAHLDPGKGDGLTLTGPIQSRFEDFADALDVGEDAALSAQIRRSETIGRPLGSDAFVEGLEQSAGRPFSLARRGPKPRSR